MDAYGQLMLIQRFGVFFSVIFPALMKNVYRFLTNSAGSKESIKFSSFVTITICDEFFNRCMMALINNECKSKEAFYKCLKKGLVSARFAYTSNNSPLHS